MSVFFTKMDDFGKVIIDMAELTEYSRMIFVRSDLGGLTSSSFVI